MEKSVSLVNSAKVDNLEVNYDHNICPVVRDAVRIVHLIPATKLLARYRINALSVNMLITASDTNSEGYPEEQLSREPLERDSQLLGLLNALTVGKSNLTAEQFSLIKSLVAEYSDVFALDMSELGSTDLASHTVKTNDSPPNEMNTICFTRKMEELIENMMAQEVLQHSGIPWASPVCLLERWHLLLLC